MGAAAGGFVGMPFILVLFILLVIIGTGLFAGY